MRGFDLHVVSFNGWSEVVLALVLESCMLLRCLLGFRYCLPWFPVGDI